MKEIILNNTLSWPKKRNTFPTLPGAASAHAAQEKLLATIAVNPTYPDPQSLS